MASAQLHAAKTRTCSGRQRPADGLQREAPREGRMRACCAGAARQHRARSGRLRAKLVRRVSPPSLLSQKQRSHGGKLPAWCSGQVTIPAVRPMCPGALHPFPRGSPAPPLRTPHEGHMSEDELKTALRETLDRRGILGTMRAHLQSEIFSAIDSQVQGPAALPARWSHDSTCHGPGRTTHAPCCLTRT